MFAPSRPGGEVPDESCKGNQSIQTVEGQFDELTGSQIITAAQDVVTASKQKHDEDNKTNRNTLFFVIVIGASSESIVVDVGHQ